MNRNVVAVVVVFALIGGIKGGEWLYDEATGNNHAIDSQDWESRELLNRRAIQKLELGSALSEITENMGTADFNEIGLFAIQGWILSE